MIVSTIDYIDGKPASKSGPRAAAECFARTYWAQPRGVEWYEPDSDNPLVGKFGVENGFATYTVSYEEPNYVIERF